ncbi:hypothetical protein BOTBODRAFT_173100 [Botryobasidium botryosum FD-172 SS1]|uniref:Uncharacterized protein n=1 Tax=Botryobasidium botryosum (strain FD-172 SS1) TaxID=930990 RepID=A0A067MWB9_BOTB1|nr:hypothetical protein BOTBODRAFT_173100 [Botryobasidium botryosum FD-172 SS1]
MSLIPDDPPARPTTPPRTTPQAAPPTPTTSRRTQEAWLRNVNNTLVNYVSHLGELNAALFADAHRPITRLLLGAALATTPSIGDLADIIAANPDWMSGPIMRLIPPPKAEDSEKDSMDEDTTDPPTHPKVKAAESKNEKRFGAIEDALARLEGLMLRSLTPHAPPPAKGEQSSGQKKPKPTPPKDSPPKETSITTVTPQATVTTQIQPAASYASAAAKGASTCKFNPSPKNPSAYRKKVRDLLVHGEVLFAPASPFGRDDNNGTINGQNGLNLINGSLKDLTPTCSVKGLRWTSRGNIMLTPELPEQSNILAKHGPAVLEQHMAKKFTVLTFGPTKDVVLHGWGATHDALPNVGNVCAKVTSALGLDPYDIVIDKSRWLVGKNTNPNRPPLLLLAISTDEAAEKLLYQNPHWIEGKKITFKVFSSDPTIPNQCARCWKVGHPTWCCGVKTPCPNCRDAHEAWDRKCVERQIQKAANPPKKRAQSPGPQSAAVDSPLRKAADLIRTIPKGRLGCPSRDISKYKDLELVKTFRLWALFNELPLIETSPSGVILWSPPPRHHLQNPFPPTYWPLTKLPWIRIGARRKGAPKHRDWVLALPLSPMPADSTPRVGIYVNRKLLPNHGLTVNPNTFTSPNAVHATISAHGKRINVFGFYHPPIGHSTNTNIRRILG